MSVRKKVMLFIITNVLVVGFFLIAPIYLLLSIAVLLLLITNFLCYSLFKARTDRDISRIKTNVEDKEISTSIRLLWYAVSALAFISFFTTAKGLEEFVFTTAYWQAYLASFAVQSILLVFNFLFFHFYILINSLETFPLFFKRVLTYFIVFLFNVAMVISSTFSFVFIANNTYLSMRGKNSNITIERFLKDETYRLKTINDVIGEDLRVEITSKTKKLNEIIAKKADITDSEIEANINKTLFRFDIEKYSAETHEFYTQEQLDADVAEAVYPEEYKDIYTILKEYKDIYDLIYNNTYLVAHNFYDNLKNAPDKSQYTNEIMLNAQIASLDIASGNIDSNLQQISELRSKHYKKYLSSYTNKAVSVFGSLKTNIQLLKSFYEAILPEYQVITASISTNTTLSADIKNILPCCIY